MSKGGCWKGFGVREAPAEPGRPLPPTDTQREEGRPACTAAAAKRGVWKDS